MQARSPCFLVFHRCCGQFRTCSYSTISCLLSPSLHFSLHLPPVSPHLPSIPPSPPSLRRSHLLLARSPATRPLDHTAALTLLHGHVPTDVYKVSVHVSDHKGLGETHHLHVTVCDCGSERMCHPYTEYGLSAGALAAIICSLLLVPLALVAALLICKCMKKKKKHQSVCQKAVHVEECSLGTVRPYNKDGGEEQQPMAMRCPPVSCSEEEAVVKTAGTVLVHQDC
ncbi:uncharacterized protein LOC142930931 [Petromyzon marinus]|uniref:uncharacterized protein LOC142930931 n=1 Tax=Petromyzon marinus TaxID=7757 RepID=UPI003F6F6909